MELLTADADVERHVLRAAPDAAAGHVTGVCLRARLVAAGSPCDSQDEACPAVRTQPIHEGRCACLVGQVRCATVVRFCQQGAARYRDACHTACHALRQCPCCATCSTVCSKRLL